MASSVLLTGGTGTLGQLVRPLLADSGCAVRILSRGGHASDGDVELATGDLATGEGIEAALDGIDTIVHCAGGPKGDDVKARNLVQAASAHGGPHLVFISVVGAERIPVVSAVDRMMFGYFASKRGAEIEVENSALPWTTLRATQFHDLVLTVAKSMTKLPVVPAVNDFRFQPVDTAEVAARLVELALGPPSGLVPDIAGPRIYTMTELIRSYLQASRRRRPIMRLKLPGEASRAVRAGANLAPDRAVGRRTWEDFLAERVG